MDAAVAPDDHSVEAPPGSLGRFGDQLRRQGLADALAVPPVDIHVDTERVGHGASQGGKVAPLETGPCPQDHDEVGHHDTEPYRGQAQHEWWRQVEDDDAHREQGHAGRRPPGGAETGSAHGGRWVPHRSARRSRHRGPQAHMAHMAHDPYRGTGTEASTVWRACSGVTRSSSASGVRMRRWRKTAGASPETSSGMT